MPVAATVPEVPFEHRVTAERLPLRPSEKAAVEAAGAQLAAAPARLLSVTLDRDAYAPGDDLWVRVWDLDATLTAQSGPEVATVVLSDPTDGRPLASAIAAADGSAVLPLPTALPDGSYALSVTAGPRSVVRTVRVGASHGDPQAPAGAVAAAAFYPEGGALVVGLASRVDVETTDSAGRPASTQGRVVDDLGRPVLEISTDRTGLAAFRLVPEAGRRYTFEAGGRTIGGLPAARSDGCVLSALVDEPVRTRVPSDVSVRCSTLRRVLVVRTSSEQITDATALLAGPAMGSILPAAGPAVPPAVRAIVHRVTLLSEALEPLAERLLWRGPHEAGVLAELDPPDPLPGQEVTVRLRAWPVTSPSATDLAVSVALDAFDPLEGPPSRLAVDLDLARWMTRLPPPRVPVDRWLPIGGFRTLDRAADWVSMPISNVEAASPSGPLPIVAPREFAPSGAALVWVPRLDTDADGSASVRFRWPDAGRAELRVEGRVEGAVVSERIDLRPETVQLTFSSTVMSLSPGDEPHMVVQLQADDEPPRDPTVRVATEGALTLHEFGGLTYASGPRYFGAAVLHLLAGPEEGGAVLRWSAEGEGVSVSRDLWFTIRRRPVMPSHPAAPLRLEAIDLPVFLTAGHPVPFVFRVTNVSDHRIEAPTVVLILGPTTWADPAVRQFPAVTGVVSVGHATVVTLKLLEPGASFPLTVPVLAHPGRFQTGPFCVAPADAPARRSCVPTHRIEVVPKPHEHRPI